MCAALAPFGTDVQVRTRIRIVGGKPVEITDDDHSSQEQQGIKHQEEKKRIRENRTPPIPTHSNFHESYITKQRQQQQQQQQIETARINSKTADYDKSFSHVHNLVNNKTSILPPINKGINSNKRDNSRPNPITGDTYTRQWSNDTGDDGSSEEEDISIPSPVLDEPDILLSEQVKSFLRIFEPNAFRDMYQDLTDFDRRLTGYVTQPQINMITLRYKLPLPTTTLRLLFSKFSHDKNPDLVNYERFIQFIARAQIGASKADTLLDDFVNRFTNEGIDIKGTEKLENHIAVYKDAKKETKKPPPDIFQKGKSHQKVMQIPPAVNTRDDKKDNQYQFSKKKEDKEEYDNPFTNRKKPARTFSDREDAKLLMMIEQQHLQGQRMDIEGLKTTLATSDKFKQGTLTRKQIQEGCLKHFLPIPGSLMDRLLQRCDTGGGMHSWVEFIEFLERVQPLPTNQSPTPKGHKDDRPGTWPSKSSESKQPSPEATLPPWERKKPLGRLGHKDIANHENRGGEETEKGMLAALAQQHRKKHSEGKNKDQDESSESWFKRFIHLAQGLYNTDSSNSGYLPSNEIRRLANNYNLIYQLGINQSRIDKVLESNKRSNGTVDIEGFLDSLRLRY